MILTLRVKILMPSQPFDTGLKGVLSGQHGFTSLKSLTLQCIRGSSRAGDGHLMSPLALKGSLELLLAGSSGSKEKSDWSAWNVGDEFMKGHPLDERFPRAENIPCDVPRQKDFVIQPCVAGWQIHEPRTASIEEQWGETFTGQWVYTAHFFGEL